MGGVEISKAHGQRCVHLHRFLRVQIEKIFIGGLMGAQRRFNRAPPFANNLRYFFRYLKINASENLCSMRVTVLFVIPASIQTVNHVVQGLDHKTLA